VLLRIAGWQNRWRQKRGKRQAAAAAAGASIVKNEHGVAGMAAANGDSIRRKWRRAWPNHLLIYYVAPSSTAL